MPQWVQLWNCHLQEGELRFRESCTGGGEVVRVSETYELGPGTQPLNVSTSPSIKWVRPCPAPQVGVGREYGNEAHAAGVSGTLCGDSRCVAPTGQGLPLTLPPWTIFQGTDIRTFSLRVSKHPEVHRLEKHRPVHPAPPTSASLEVNGRGGLCSPLCSSSPMATGPSLMQALRDCLQGTPPSSFCIISPLYLL